MMSSAKVLPLPLDRQFMLAAATGLLMAAFVQPADAQSGRPDSRSMTCEQVQSMIAQRGAVVLSTGQYTFDRYVSNRNSCQRSEVLKTDYVPTKDAKRCAVRRCVGRSQFIFD